MNVQVYILLSALAVLQCVAQKSGPESEFYTAAVVEYAPFEIRADEDPLLVMPKNALNHMYYMEQAARKGADLIVFPECGLTGIELPTSRKELRPYLTEIPEPKHQPNPCVDATGNVSQLLKDLSCASRRYGIYSVMNLPEIAPCRPAAQDGGKTTCPDDGAFIYNTNIVFDRSGVIIARYRKYNLFLEPGFDIEPTAAHCTFDTDFGVRFGMFICFDILFHQPAVAMVTEQNITDVVYSTAWFSELPFLTAVQTQAAWSYTMDTNFLASGYNKPANKNTGSGIFAGRDGVVTSVMAFDQLNQMLVAKVKKKKRSNTNERGTAAHGTRAKRSDNEGDREGSFEKNGESEGSEEVSGYLFPRSPLKQKRQEETCVKEDNDAATQNIREYENNKGSSEIRNVVKRNVVFADGVEIPTENVLSEKTHRTFEPELHLFNTILLNLPNVEGEGKRRNESLFLCHLSLCCNFTLSTSRVHEVETNRVDGEFYRAGVFDGGDELRESYQTCLIMRCISPDLDSCRDGFDHAKYQTSVIIFTEIKIDGQFKKGGKINSGYNNSMHFIDDVGFNKQHLVMSNNQEIRNLSIFSLHVDGFPNEHDANLLPYGHLHLFQDDLSHYNTLLIGSQNVNKQLNLCHGSFCCQFYIEAETEINSTYEEVPVNNSQTTFNNGYYFRIGVFEGKRKFVLTIEAGLQVCALFACTTDNITTCGLLKNETITRIDNEVDVPQTTQTTSSDSVVDINEASSSLDEGLVLKRVEIKGYFEKENLIMPDTVTSKLLPFKGLDFEFSSDSKERSNVDKSKTFVTMKANSAALGDMLTFGIYARDFRKDVA